MFLYHRFALMTIKGSPYRKVQYTIEAQVIASYSLTSLVYSTIDKITVLRSVIGDKTALRRMV